MGAILIMFGKNSSAGGLAGAITPRLFAGVLAATALNAVPAHAADDATADAQAALIDGFQLQNVDPLQFGRIIPGGLGGSVMINANTGAVSTIGQVVTVGTNQSRARFTVKAPVGVIMIIAGDPTVELSLVGGTGSVAETMTASLTHRGTTGLVTTTVLGLPIGLIATSPDQEIYTGGSLVVAGNQAEGAYEGSFTLLVSYL